jgi:trehalose 6-phosphate synthase/phosphatase
MNKKQQSENRLIIVSNRLPIILTKFKDGSWRVDPGSGGLVTALAPVLKNRGGVWIGWPGNVEEDGLDTQKLLEEESNKIGYTLKAVNLTYEEKENYYKGFANEVLWPLFHDFTAHCNFFPRYWYAYQRVNQKFAEVIATNIDEKDFIWVHDYHLISVAKMLRNAGIRNKIGFFLHIPFPPPDIFVRLPWRYEILNTFLEYDLIGFQTFRDRRNFLQCIRTFVKETRGSGKGQVISVIMPQKDIRIGSFPISIDFNEFSKSENAREARDLSGLFSKRKVILGVDRLDYSKGILERMHGFREALNRHPDLRRKLSLIQVVVPSRRNIAKYEDLKIEIDRLVGEINGQFTESDWVPIHYIFRSLGRSELVAYYRAADIGLVTPLKDGMNLIAKEYCASNIAEDGVLILSEFAGAAAQFQKGALLVNPYHIEGIAEVIEQAFYMPLRERKIRMQRLRQNIRKYDIFWWVDSFLQAAIEKNLDNFPLLEDYIPLAEDRLSIGNSEHVEII